MFLNDKKSSQILTPQINCYMALDYRQAGHKKQLLSFRIDKNQVSLHCVKNEVMKQIHLDRIKRNIVKFIENWGCFPNLITQSIVYLEDNLKTVGLT